MPALHCSDPQVSPTPCSILQYKALLTALALKATYSDLQELCCVKEKGQHQTWCQDLIRTRPLEIPMTQTQLDSPRPSTPFSPDFLLLQQNLQLNVSSPVMSVSPGKQSSWAFSRVPHPPTMLALRTLSRTIRHGTKRSLEQVWEGSGVCHGQTSPCTHNSPDNHTSGQALMTQKPSPGAHGV